MKGWIKFTEKREKYPPFYMQISQIKRIKEGSDGQALIYSKTKNIYETVIETVDDVMKLIEEASK